MNQEEYDREVYDIVVAVWDAYRESTKGKNAKPFNDVFKCLYLKHDNDSFTHIISYLGMAFAPSINRAVGA